MCNHSLQNRFVQKKETFSVNTSFLSQYRGKRLRYVNWSKNKIEGTSTIHMVKMEIPVGKSNGSRAIPVCEASETNGLWYEAIQFFHSFKSFQQQFGYTVKFRKWAPGLFQRPFLRGLILEGLIFGGAYLWRRNWSFKIDWVSLIVARKFTVFALFYFVFEGNFQVQAPWGLLFGGAI